MWPECCSSSGRSYKVVPQFRFRGAMWLALGQVLESCSPRGRNQGSSFISVPWRHVAGIRSVFLSYSARCRNHCSSLIPVPWATWPESGKVLESNNWNLINFGSLGISTEFIVLEPEFPDQTQKLQDVTYVF
jgi:hypothetical protein